MIDEAAQVIAVTLIQRAYAHLPDTSRAGAIAQADTQPMAKAIKAIALEGYTAGLEHGERRGRAKLTAEMEADWTPVAERVRAQANSPSFKELERRRNDELIDAEPYTGGAVAPW